MVDNLLDRLDRIEEEIGIKEEKVGASSGEPMNFRSFLIANSWSEDVSAQMLPNSTDIDVEEAGIAENATVTNKTTSTNTPGANSQIAPSCIALNTSVTSVDIAISI